MSLPLSAPSVAFRSDDSNRVRYISQYAVPFALPESDPDQTMPHLAELYLTDAMENFGFTDQILSELNSEPATDLEKNYWQLRLGNIHEMQGFSIFLYAQTYFGIPVWQKGLTLNIKSQHLEVVRCLTSFTFDEITLEAPDPPVLDNYANITSTELLDLLGIATSSNLVVTDSTPLYVFQYLAADRFNDTIEDGGAPWFNPSNLPNVSSEIVEAGFYLVRMVSFTYPSTITKANWIVFIEINSGSVLRIEIEVALVQAKLFENDPMTMTGSTAITILNATRNNLDQLRTGGQLNNLVPPNYNVYPNVLYQQLHGTYVKILDAITDQGDPALQYPPNTSIIPSRPYTGEPPSVASPYNFDYHADTDAFSAICAYYFADKFLSMIHQMGFT